MISLTALSLLAIPQQPTLQTRESAPKVAQSRGTASRGADKATPAHTLPLF
ncbi:hypothetical protein [Sphingomicrobium marinum]|uniref:hypothetical protein n=1 Tax=Sphingomicrobium marinum TaxID=1227950 RepID=UPI00223EE18B|nr:hypothetical protein [Sphingomicrobium marinum]